MTDLPCRFLVGLGGLLAEHHFVALALEIGDLRLVQT